MIKLSGVGIIVVHENAASGYWGMLNPPIRVGRVEPLSFIVVHVEVCVLNSRRSSFCRLLERRRDERRNIHYPWSEMAKRFGAYREATGVSVRPLNGVDGDRREVLASLTGVGILVLVFT